MRKFHPLKPETVLLDVIAVHKVLLDDQNKLVSWIGPSEVAYDKVLHARWDFVKNKVPNSPGPEPMSSYPPILLLLNLKRYTWHYKTGYLDV